MTINVYFWTDIRTIRRKEGAFYAALSAETPKGEVWIPHKGKVTANINGASIRALHETSITSIRTKGAGSLFIPHRPM